MGEYLSFTIAMNDDAPDGASLCGGFRDEKCQKPPYPAVPKERP